MIDVLLPYRGDAQLMRDAVASVRAQTSPDWRLHVLDDADPDPSVSDWLQGLDDPRVQVVRNEHNLGVNGAFRRCLEFGEADWVTFMGCDDLMHPDHLARLERLVLSHPGAAMYQPGVRVIDEAGREYHPLADRVKAVLAPGRGTHRLAGEHAVRSLMRGNWLYFPSVLWRRSALEEHPFRPGLETALDLRLVMDLLLAGESLVVDDATTFDYRRHARSASATTARTAERFAEETLISCEVAEECLRVGWPRAARAARARPTVRLHAAVLAVARARAGDVRGGVRMLGGALG